LAQTEPRPNQLNRGLGLLGLTLTQVGSAQPCMSLTLLNWNTLSK